MSLRNSNKKIRIVNGEICYEEITNTPQNSTTNGQRIVNPYFSNNNNGAGSATQQQADVNYIGNRNRGINSNQQNQNNDNFSSFNELLARPVNILGYSFSTFHFLVFTFICYYLFNIHGLIAIAALYFFFGRNQNEQ
eukprot:TRINITY_DN516_c1_g1_i1.p1 TRINITY_DN516_c1_g1~~TRINITY_DN516_c1_g1_i1.p1  ORF type:complete len:137 (-),score=60.24 TRINITY_DN516_c1_g1_i1:88-498(-)